MKKIWSVVFPDGVDLSDILLLLALVFFFAHSMVYILLIAIHPGFIADTFLENNFFFTLRWLDPSLWLFWAFGILMFARAGIFKTRRYPFLVLAAFLAYGFSIIPALWFGFVYGMAVYFGALLFVLGAIYLDRQGDEKSRFA